MLLVRCFWSRVLNNTIDALNGASSPPKPGSAIQRPRPEYLPDWSCLTWYVSEPPLPGLDTSIHQLTNTY